MQGAFVHEGPKLPFQIGVRISRHFLTITNGHTSMIPTDELTYFSTGDPDTDNYAEGAYRIGPTVIADKDTKIARGKVKLEIVWIKTPLVLAQEPKPSNN